MLQIFRRVRPFSGNSHLKFSNPSSIKGWANLYPNGALNDERFLNWSFKEANQKELEKRGLKYKNSHTVVPRQSMLETLNLMYKEGNRKLEKRRNGEKLTVPNYDYRDKALIQKYKNQCKVVFSAEEDMSPSMLLQWQHQVELKNLTEQAQSKLQKKRYKRAYNKLKNQLYRKYSYTGSVSQAANQLRQHDPAELSMSVRGALHEFENARNEFCNIFPARAFNADYFPGTIRGRFLILDNKSGGIEPGLLMVNILNPDGSVNRKLARDLIRFLGDRSPFNNAREIRSLDDMLRLIDVLREEGRCLDYMKALQGDIAGGYEQKLYLLKQDYDEINRAGNRIGVGIEQIEKTKTFADGQRKKIKNSNSYNPFKKAENVLIDGKIFLWDKYGKAKISEQNKGAVIEVLSTQLVGAVMPKQAQEISVLQSVYADGTKKYMPLCVWEPKLTELTDHVQGKDKYKILAKNGVSSSEFNDVGGHLIAMIMTGDYDGIGSRCQNKGAVKDSHGNFKLYAFDVGHAYADDRNIMLETLDADFSFSTKDPRLFANDFKNYSIFNDFRDDEKMEGVFKLYRVLTPGQRAWFFPSQSRRDLITAAIEDYCETNPDFEQQYNAIVPGSCEILFNQYQRDYPEYAEDIQAMRGRFYCGAERIFNVFGANMICTRVQMKMLFSLRHLTSKTQPKENGMQLKHLRVVPKGKLIWSFYRKNKNSFTLGYDLFLMPYV
ncbi:MAG: hypothetical protein GY821_09180 [Gammaproteobacteria bacterium]|nr:hypothetical protein [Gammaproteobacteria bacterium]